MQKFLLNTTKAGAGCRDAAFHGARRAEPEVPA
jgi:hypothetical protein